MSDVPPLPPEAAPAPVVAPPVPEVPHPVAPVLTPRERLAELKVKKPNPASVFNEGVRTESEEIEFRVLGEQIAQADRLKELQAMTARTDEQDAELKALDRPEIVALVV